MNAQIDIDRIKQTIRIEDLVAQSFTVTGRGRILTTVEHDSLKLFTANNSWTWYSRAGRAGKALGGSVIDWWMLSHNCDEREAIGALGALVDGGIVLNQVPPAAPVAEPAKVQRWKADDWQADVRRQLQQAQDRLLNRPSGQPGREYLAARGIEPSTWAAWGLGYGPAWNAGAGCTMPAVWLPWMNQRISALQWRFLTEDHKLRFGQQAGGERFLFGLQHLVDAAPGSLGTLLLVEGEMNAISLHQVIEAGKYPADAISFGPQANISNYQVQRMAAAVARRYKRVIVWADEPDAALAGLGAMPPALRSLAVRSPGGRDANDLLVAGQLDDVLLALLKKVSGG